MRIAQIAPVWFTVPPRAYGGIELVVSLLADGLTEAGHDVTLFASGGSETKATLVSPLAEPPDPALLGTTWFEASHAVASYMQAGAFDVIHDHSGIVGPGFGALLDGQPPVAHTLHGPWTEPSKEYYRLVHERIHLVAISHSQRLTGEKLRYAGTVYNGIDVTAYPFRADKQDYLVYMGRSNPDKGPGLAVEVARRAGVPLKMIVKKSERFEQDYWDNVVAPQLTDMVEVYEQVSHAEKAEMLAGAKGMIFPIRWLEPFGLVMTEAMACGTPVVTAPMGAAPEIVVDGETGFLRDSVDDMVAVVDRLGDLDPRACRARVEEHFSAEAMVRGYEAIFERLAAA
jgi:glycosyltransferase involved in cell wall biosynthesis